MLKHFFAVGFLVSQLLCGLNASAGSVKNMVLLSDSQLSAIEARGMAKTFTKVELQYASKIILWDEQMSTNNGQVQINGGLNGNNAFSANSVGMGH